MCAGLSNKLQCFVQLTMLCRDTAWSDTRTCHRAAHCYAGCVCLSLAQKVRNFKRAQYKRALMSVATVTVNCLSGISCILGFPLLPLKCHRRFVNQHLSQMLEGGVVCLLWGCLPLLRPTARLALKLVRLCKASVMSFSDGDAFPSSFPFACRKLFTACRATRCYIDNGFELDHSVAQLP